MKRLLLLTLLAAACSRGGAPGGITLGAAGPWNQGFGHMNQLGIELARDEINASPDGKAHPLTVVFENDSGRGRVASRIAQSFVDSAKILGVIGHVNSGAMVSAAQVYDGHVAAVATTATSPELTGISRWVFRVIPSDSANGVGIARFAAARGRRRAAILYENNSYGRGLADAFRRAFPGTVISIDPIGEGKDQSFEPYISFFKQRRPDIVFVAGTDLSGLELLREVRRQQLDVDLMGGDGWSGLSVDTARSEGVFAGVPFTAEDRRPEAQRFVRAFQKKFDGMMPDNNAALAYDATMLLYTAARRGGTRARVRDYLAALTPESPFTGVTGAIAFRADGDPIGMSVVMTRIHRGALTVAEVPR